MFIVVLINETKTDLLARCEDVIQTWGNEELGIQNLAIHKRPLCALQQQGLIFEVEDTGGFHEFERKNILGYWT